MYFDCIYCECGFNSDHRPKKPLPTREEVRAALEARLQDMQKNGPVPDVLTFAGNGERIVISHLSSSRAGYAQGAVKAAIWEAGKKPGLIP